MLELDGNTQDLHLSISGFGWSLFFILQVSSEPHPNEFQAIVSILSNQWTPQKLQIDTDLFELVLSPDFEAYHTPEWSSFRELPANSSLSITVRCYSRSMRWKDTA